jgi:hypothetical protein
MRRALSLAAGTIIMISALPAWAGTPAGARSGSPPPAQDGTDGTRSPPVTTAAGAAAEPGATPPLDAKDPEEIDGTKYQFIGARFRYGVIPKFMINLFGDGGANIPVPAFGVEYSSRRSKMETTFGAMYATYSMTDTPFKSSSDDAIAWEKVNVNLHVLYLTADMMWGKPVHPKTLDVIYGVGTGLGFVWGDMSRYQITPGNPPPKGASDPSTWVACPTNAAGTGPLIPANVAGHDNYCDSSNNHYGNYKDTSWFGGGSKPAIFPWLSPQFGFRWKPSADFVMRLELGWNIFNGPFFGLATQFGM